MKIAKLLIALLVLLAIITGCSSSSDSDDSTGDDSSNGGSQAFCSIIGVSSRSLQVESGISPDSAPNSSRIINGEECSENNSPIVQLNLLSSNGNVFICSGTMITNNHVLTAAHCFFEDITTAFIQVNGETVAGEAIAIHPGNSELRDRVNNDVAILRLVKEVNLPTIPLMRSSTVTGGEEILIYGFGQDENFSNSNNTRGALRGGKMTVDSADSQHIFARFDGSDQNTCLGDSGGPALVNSGGRLGIVGVTSSGALENCAAGDLSLFANTQGDSIFDFILSIVPNAGVV